MYFKPYGGVRWAQSGILGPDSDSATRRSYTGQYEETSQWLGSLMHYKARYYSPFLHRFTQPDTILPGAGNPQNLNRFMYVRGNPTGANDPTGHVANWLIGAGIGAAVGAGLYLWSESQQADGIDLGFSVSVDMSNPFGLSVNIGSDWGDLAVAAGMGAVAGALIATPGGQGVGDSADMNLAGANMAVNLVGDHLTNVTTGSNFNSVGHTVTGGVAAVSGYAGGVPMPATSVGAYLAGKTMMAGTIGFVGGGLKSMAFGEEYTLESAAANTILPAIGAVGTAVQTASVLNSPFAITNPRAAQVWGDQTGNALTNFYSFVTDAGSRSSNPR